VNHIRGARSGSQDEPLKKFQVVTSSTSDRCSICLAEVSESELCGIHLTMLQRSVVPSSFRLCSTKRFFYVSSWRRADPWLLPNTPEHLKSTTTPPDLPPPTPLARPNESVETLRARLLYQSRKRGTLESDLLLSTFARDHLSEMSGTQMKEYDKVSRFHRILVWLF
jgi:hypothetical protein